LIHDDDDDDYSNNNNDDEDDDDDDDVKGVGDWLLLNHRRRLDRPSEQDERLTAE
jgi:hypothetical protein